MRVMTVLLRHDNIAFEDEVVLVTGHAYFNCVFTRCTLIVRSLSDTHLENCRFNGCVWHLDVLVYDVDAWTQFQQNAMKWISESLPNVTPPPSPSSKLN
jgi:hypothetical protein